MLPRLLFPGDISIGPWHQIHHPILEFDGDQQERDRRQSGELPRLLLQGRRLMPRRRLNEDARRLLHPEKSAFAACYEGSIIHQQAGRTASGSGC